MARTIVVTGAASGIGAATARPLRKAGERVITSDLHDADVIADLATPAGREALVKGVARLADGRIDAIVANAGGGPPETSVQLNFFGAVATLEGLRPLLAGSAAPRAVAVSSVASLREPFSPLIEACLAGDEAKALDAARRLADERLRAPASDNAMPAAAQIPLDLYGNAKQALQLWCRRAAATAPWAGEGVVLNVVALGFYDTPAAAYVLSNPQARAAVAPLVPLKGAFPGRADEAAELLAFLVSAENSQVTGQIIFADGGIESKAREVRL
jgi:NAD(P)-dependent dehydrogenase (short-subunit alcohol dehydrogenase family)